MTRTGPLGLEPNDGLEQVHTRQSENAYSLIEKLRERRKREGLRQKDLAARMGRDTSVVSNIERLGSDPRWSTVRRYASALGVVIEYDITPAEEYRISDQVKPTPAPTDVDPLEALPRMLAAK